MADIDETIESEVERLQNFKQAANVEPSFKTGSHRTARGFGFRFAPDVRCRRLSRRRT